MKRSEADIVKLIEFLINLHKDQIDQSKWSYGGLYLTGFIHDEGEDDKVGQFELEGNAFDSIIFNIPVYKNEDLHEVERIILQVLKSENINLYDDNEDWQKACEQKE